MQDYANQDITEQGNEKVPYYCNSIGLRGWSFRRSFDYCFCGLSEGGTVAISTNGVLNNYVSLRLFKEGVFELERRLRPEVIFIYGDKIELRTNARLIWHPNTQIIHLRKHDSQKRNKE